MKFMNALLYTFVTSMQPFSSLKDSSWNTLYLRLLAEPVHLSADSRVLCRCTADLPLEQNRDAEPQMGLSENVGYIPNEIAI